MMMIDYQVILQHDMAVNECVTVNEDCSYTIFINDELCPEKREKAFEHAMSHICNDDFYKCDVQEIETAAHGL